MSILYILLALLIFGMLIFIHELGHFIVARLCGVKVLEFAIGMGPRLFSWKGKKSGTVYALRLFPIGGFVNMLGENGMEAVQGENGVEPRRGKAETLVNEVEDEEAERAEAEDAPPAIDPELEKHAYCNQSVWKRLLISLAGPFMNVFLGFVLMLVLVLLAGHDSMATTKIGGFDIYYSAEEAYGGFEEGDYLHALDGDRILSYAELEQRLEEHPGKVFEVTVRRVNDAGTKYEYETFSAAFDEKMLKSLRRAGGETSGLQINDTILKVNSTSVHTYNELYYELTNQGYHPVDLTIERNGKKMVLEDVRFYTQQDSGVWFGWVDLVPYREAEFNFASVMKHTWFRSLSTVKTVFDSLVGLFTGRFGLEAMSGPIGITKQVSTIAQMGFTSLLYFVVIISINLGIMNLLPLPALDGGHILIYLIEAVRRKPMKKELEAIINFIGLILILSLAVIVAIKDVISLL
ncbi:MAG: RIP metalloprotease RseP [Clostridia bacterium]|nr:RIP metalloprotease RseP [Clostridia bacterium]